MINKPSLTFYTNIPTPYQLSFFNELSKLFTLTVVYYSATENNREWDFNLDFDYQVIVLKNNSIAKAVQKKIVDFHFSWQIFKTVWSDKSENIIVGGSYWIPNGFFALLLSRIKGKKVAYYSEPLFEVKGKIKYAVKWLMLRILTLTCNAIFCIGRKAARSFEAFGVNTPKFIIPYNINSKEFINIDESKKRDFIERYKPNGEIILLSSGSLIERKGMDVLIAAFTQIKRDDARLIIIGDGSQKAELQKSYGADHRIILAGFQKPDDIPYFFAIADIFAFASRYDGWAVVINEAIAANLPVISSDHVGAALELITSPELGIVCKSDNVDDFKSAMQTLIFDETKRIEIKQASVPLIPLISSDYYAAKVYDIFTRQLA
ncbi:glycosyltransferase family 4 protein [Mucilaginibacter sp. CSA2-8R]|uniref:glycosyltransferase family 4 protein n=1 Tax=Mucilaginibacter sp. CSA2-8R TaxID=3141542 RepID=UPI00315C97E4